MELELKSKRFALVLRKKAAVEAREQPQVVYQVIFRLRREVTDCGLEKTQLLGIYVPKHCCQQQDPSFDSHHHSELVNGLAVSVLYES